MSIKSFDSDTLINKKYRLIELIGGGGMGQVWKAEDVRHDRRLVAIKFIVWQRSDDNREKRERFRKEMQALARLDHPHIVHLIEFDETSEGTPYLVMNLVPGDSLQERLEKRGLDAATRSRVLKELCEALDYIHGQNVVHRDLKPSNILFDASDHVRISDFGLAKLVDITPVVSVFAGTPRFQAPEQSMEALAASLDRGERPTIDHRADIYALGVITWLLFTGQFPDDPPSPSADRLSPDLKQALHKAFAYDRENRYNSAGEFLEALTSATSRRRRLPIWAWGVVGGVILLLAVAGAWLMGPGPQAAPEPSLATVTSTSTSTPMPAPPTVTSPSAGVSFSLPTSTPSVTPSSTSSSAPTATPSSAATPTPYLTVSDDEANVYDGPGQEYRTQKKVVKGDILPVLGRSENGVWLYVDCLGWNLWIATQSITIDADIQTLSVIEAFPLPVNQSPVIEEIEIASTTIEAWGVISVTCQASDPDGDELTYTWEASDGFITGEGDSVTYNAPEITGNQTITITVQDENGREAKGSVQVQIIPLPTCPSEPAGNFGQVWREHPEIHQKLGCATRENGTTAAARQSFQQGVMFWRRDIREIYVLTQDGNWRMYVDTWEEDMDEYSCPEVAERKTPPTPRRGFGKVWCEQLGGPNAEVGWATNDELPYDAQWQRFEHGLMWQGLDGRIYVLPENDSWQSYPFPASGSSSSWSGTPSQRIRVGDRARVCTAYHRLAVRAGPRRSSSEIARLEPGAYVTVVDGPAYADGWSWWKVRIDSGEVGWVAEGGDEVDPYFICPER